MPPINVNNKRPAGPARATTKTPPMPIKTVPAAVANLGPALRGTPLSIALAKPTTPPSAVVPGLVHEGQSTFVRVAKEIDAQIYAAIISVAVATGLKLSPYGKCMGGRVLFAYSSAIAARVIEQSQLLCDKFKSADKREAVKSNLCLYRTDLGFDNEGSLVGHEGRKQFDLAIPPNCKLAVFFDAARCLRKQACDEEDFRQFGQLLNDLNRNGIATLVFYCAGKKADAAFAEELLTDCNGYTLELTEDRAAPREYGTGFTVKRRKASEHDTVPTYFQFWYTVMNKELNFGWECRAPDDMSNHKQIEIAERQKRVADLLDSGMQQKDIAAALGVNSATVSRDVSAVKAKARKSSKDDTAAARSKDLPT